MFFPRQRDWHILAAGAWRAIPQAAGPGRPGQGHSVWERSGSGCRAEGSSSRSTTPRPLSFRYILTRKSACSARTTSQKGPQMSGSEMDGPPELGGMGVTEGARSPPGCRTFWGEGCPVGPAWPGRGWPRDRQWVSEQLPSPKPIPPVQGTAGSWRHEGGEGGRGQARACMLKEPQFPAA